MTLPARHFILVDYKPHILAAIKKVCGDPVTNLFPRQAKFVHDPKVIISYPATDATVERFSDLSGYELDALLAVHP